MITYLIIAGILSFIGMLVQSRLKSKFHKYSQVSTDSGKSGAEIARDMLSHYGIEDVQIKQGKGTLTDHYNPRSKTVTLSPGVYEGRNVAAAAVAAHECGHAVQHAEAYAWLQLRSAIVPVVSIAAKAQQWLLILALGFFGTGTGGGTLLTITIIAYAITTLFSFITLPVEFDASNRALAWLDNSGNMLGVEHEGAEDALWWAAMTYVAAALSALVILLYLFLLRE